VACESLGGVRSTDDSRPFSSLIVVNRRQQHGAGSTGLFGMDNSVFDLREGVLGSDRK
jgi:hypothetical protein